MRLSISTLLLAAAIAPVSMTSLEMQEKDGSWNEFGRAKKRVGWAWDWGAEQNRESGNQECFEVSQWERRGINRNENRGFETIQLEKEDVSIRR